MKGTIEISVAIGRRVDTKIITEEQYEQAVSPSTLVASVVKPMIDGLRYALQQERQAGAKIRSGAEDLR